MKAILTVAAVLSLGSTVVHGEEVDKQSFFDVVRTGGARPDFEQELKEAEESAAIVGESEEEIAALVHRFVFEVPASNDAWEEKQTLAYLGEEAYPAALEILRDPTLREKLVTLTRPKKGLPEAPIMRLCEIFDLDAPPPPEAAELLAPFLKNDNPEIRERVALIVGSIGSEQSMPLLQVALTDEVKDVRAWAMMGVERAVSRGRVDPASRGRLFDLLAALWPEDDSYGVSRALPSVLLELDRDRAVEYLFRSDLFTPQFRPLFEIFSAFDRASVEVPRPSLLGIIAEAGKEPIEYPMDYVLQGALPLLAKHRAQEDLPLLERFLDHPNEDVSSGAVRALYVYHRYYETVREPWGLWESNGWDALTDAEKHVCAVEELDSEVRNGGFGQYYFNSSGDRWQEALAGLDAIGADARHRIMAQTIERYGDAPPSTDRDERSDQLARLLDEQEDPFEECDSAWYKAPPLDPLIYRYNMANVDGRERQ